MAAERRRQAPGGSRDVTAGPPASRRVSGRTPVVPLPPSDPKRPVDLKRRTSDPPARFSPEVCSFQSPEVCNFRLPLTSCRLSDRTSPLG